MVDNNTTAQNVFMIIKNKEGHNMEPISVDRFILLSMVGFGVLVSIAVILLIIIKATTGWWPI